MSRPWWSRSAVDQTGSGDAVNIGGNWSGHDQRDKSIRQNTSVHNTIRGGVSLQEAKEFADERARELQQHAEELSAARGMITELNRRLDAAESDFIAVSDDLARARRQSDISSTANHGFGFKGTAILVLCAALLSGVLSWWLKPSGDSTDNLKTPGPSPSATQSQTALSNEPSREMAPALAARRYVNALGGGDATAIRPLLTEEFLGAQPDQKFEEVLAFWRGFRSVGLFAEPRVVAETVDASWVAVPLALYVADGSPSLEWVYWSFDREGLVRQNGGSGGRCKVTEASSCQPTGAPLS
jgi:hypothetical protein